ncbi:hypothetical protein KJ765_02175 [Candidatus Micrarchaeota archaeon]|nr:hypothetical protein [Candidatus Micrarchaeota archaeon]
MQNVKSGMQYCSDLSVAMQFMKEGKVRAFVQRKESDSETLCPTVKRLISTFAAEYEDEQFRVFRID